MIINRIIVENNKLFLSVAVSCPYNIDVTSPKVKIFFEKDGKTRRLPLLVTNYFRQKQSESCVVVCNYSFLIDKLFFNDNSDDDIKARIDFYYGDEEVIGVPFNISSNVILENPELEIGDEYIEYECIDGTAVFDSEGEYETSNEKYFDKYSIGFDFNENRIILKKTEKARKRNKFNPVSQLIKFVFFILRVALAIVLAPYFILDGLFAALGVLPKRATKPIDSLGKNIFVQIKINFSSFLKTSFMRARVIDNIRKPMIAFCKFRYKRLCKNHKIVSNRMNPK